ncbi:hypothetical protein Pyn_04323 [Prunus yedoensis var. nudiflora]|uniref:Uncharacterized protein n=1 Tax=Prunus yedoensis var. nudiflora TaxID=2094558 RepID=A0A314UCU3_PRUYE|nr:hypothetical protein Pyn_04323 [Prunus yedoensis var. nudiflora]
MEEGSPGVFLKDYRLTKRSRAKLGRQDAFVSDAISAPMVAHDSNSGQNLNHVMDTMKIAELFVNGVARQSGYGKCEPSTRGEGLGKKEWTKSKAVKSDVRVAWNDISNMPQ